MTRLTPTDHRALIDAVNLVCDYATKHLPGGWSIILTMQNGECWSELENPEGDRVDDCYGEHNYSSIVAMCDRACEVEL